jgi:hypothetical protein
MSTRAPDPPRSELGKTKGGFTRPGPSAFGVTENRPANPYGDKNWTGLGSAAPEAMAAHAARENAKLMANRPKAQGGDGILVPAAKRTGQIASNAAGKGKAR